MTPWHLRSNILADFKSASVHNHRTKILEKRMTASIESKSPSWWLYLSPFGAGLVRAIVGTPLDVVATREIVDHQNTLQVLKGMTFPNYWKGFQPNVLKFITRTPAQFVSLKISSSIVPTDWYSSIRGGSIGILSNGMEAGLANVWNSLRTRFIQGENWSVLKKEGASVLTKGLSSALVHRILSGAIFWSVYEQLKEKYPSHGKTVSAMTGVVQVFLTSPFYIAAVYKQRINATPEYLHRTFLHLFRTQGLRGLFLPALAPRLVHSIIITPPLMWLMEKLQLIHRKN
jgi:hypothetical protein